MFIPGGLGSTNNFKDLNLKKFQMNVCEEVQDVLVDFHDKKKHIGLSNTSSILALRAFDD